MITRLRHDTFVTPLQEVESEIQSQYREFQVEKEDLLDSLRLLSQQMLLKDAIIAAFIPQEEVDKALARARWDEEGDDWVLDPPQSMAPPPLEHGSRSSGGRGGAAAPNVQGGSTRLIAVPGAKRPTCAFTSAAVIAGDMNPRFRQASAQPLHAAQQPPNQGWAGRPLPAHASVCLPPPSRDPRTPSPSTPLTTTPVNSCQFKRCHCEIACSHPSHCFQPCPAS